MTRKSRAVPETPARVARLLELNRAEEVHLAERLAEVRDTIRVLEGRQAIVGKP